MTSNPTLTTAPSGVQGALSPQPPRIPNGTFACLRPSFEGEKEQPRRGG